MTNASSQKRPWEGGSDDGAKRKRAASPADWRDVHLKDRDRNDRNDRGDRDRRRRRDDDYHSAGRRDRDYRDRDRRRRSRERRHHRDYSDDYRRSRTRSPRSVREITPVAVDDEKEEGEISPRPSPPPSARRRTPPRRHRDDYRNHSRSYSRDRSRDRYHEDRRSGRSPLSTTRSPRSARGHSPPLRRPSLAPASVPSPTVSQPQSADVAMADASPAPVEEPEEETAPTPPQKSEEEILAERRARRAAIKAKYEGSRSVVDTAPGTPNPATGSQALSTISTTAPSASGTPSGVVNEAMSKVTLAGDPGTPTVSTPGPEFLQRGSASPPPTSAADQNFELAKDGEDDAKRGEIIANAAEPAGGDQINAADYDPSLDRREDERKRFGVDQAANGTNHHVNGQSGSAIDVDMEDEDEDDEADEESEEEDLDDMFAVALGGDEEKPKKKKKKATGKKKTKENAATLGAPNVIVDAAADPEGYYRVILGERIDNGRYQVFSSLGQGMFANVVRARVLKDENGKDLAVDGVAPESLREVAIKIIRSQESMYKAGLKEAQILQKLRALDPEDKKHIVKLERTFEHRGHLCLVFENLSMNLREVVKRFGKDVGLNIRAVRAYAHQLFLALSLLRKANIMHADIKPDNILVNEQKNLIKLCDLGSASDASENEITPYLVSRFYRAPEIILGVPYDPALDVWSIGCTLYELYTGKILFPGRSNNQMLRLMMELKGRFNTKIIKKAKFGETYFDELGAFESVERDRLTGSDITRKIHIQKPTRDLRARLMPSSSVKLNDEETKMLANFIDLLDKCLMLDPARRITPREALSHPFIRG